MEERKVIAMFDLILDKAEPPVFLKKGTVCAVEDVIEDWIILRLEDGASCMTDIPTFEVGFEAYQ